MTRGPGDALPTVGWVCAIVALLLRLWGCAPAPTYYLPANCGGAAVECETLDGAEVACSCRPIECIGAPAVDEAGGQGR
jgi:hypothetical protein